jgi:cell volume regulation protein A
MEFGFILLIAGVVLLLSVLSSKIMYRLGVPTLILFMSLGVLLGSEGLGGIEFNDVLLTGTISQIALVVIIFSGGFDTSWKSAKKTAPLSLTLSSLGTLFTALLVGVFAHYVLGIGWIEGFLLGSVISSTDAASVFTILRSKNLNLKGELASILEVESGSNDPFAFSLTVFFLSLLLGTESITTLSFLLILQIGVGALVGLGIGFAAVYLINRINLAIDGLYMVVMVGIMFLSYGLTLAFNGNGYLAVYLTGIVLANKPITHKISLIRFFDGLTWIMQIFLFFTLGLLVYPSQVLSVFWEGLAVAFFISFIARPIAVFIIMKLFKRSWKEMVLVSWVGFRGAASIEFTIFVLISLLTINSSFGPFLFNVVFFVAFFSVLLQGTTLTPLAKLLGLTEKNNNVLTTFSDYRGDTYAELSSIQVEPKAEMVGHAIRDLDIPDHILIVMIKRKSLVLTPKASTVIQSNDILMLASDSKKELIDVTKMAQFKPKRKRKS